MGEIGRMEEHLKKIGWDMSLLLGGEQITCDRCSGYKESFRKGGNAGCDGAGEVGGEDRLGLGGKGRSLKDLKLSAGELGRFSSSTSAPGSSLTRGPGFG